MFHIQYEAVDGSHKMQVFDSKNRARLVAYLATFERPIAAVYEQSTVVTKAVRKELAAYSGSKTRYARDFISSLQ